MHLLIVEDETSIARRTLRLVKEILGDDLKQIEIRSSLADAKTYIGSHSIDLLLLDLNLSGKDGFEVLQSVAAEAFDTIIISAYRDRAIDAFEYGVVDFVSKPFDISRLRKAIERFRNKNKRSDQPITQLAIKQQGKIILIPVAEIQYIQGANIYSEVYLNQD